ncbi:U-box domain-containing protein 33-like [Juglans microcarpa x Juglans regia]|uniref:U-box domain-containing protein 33-like n=1 Tax=Juglans microcarpa x Juglans regia TaxID=2249226 RepID=UPI001B7E046A|nr:U-box domain-containing protein 33-like [Juglans microcarpa x Juglans regia]
MASRQESSEDTIFVALGIKDAKEWISTLRWAIQNSGGKKICILHIHQPAQLIPFGMGGRAPASSLQESIVREYRETEKQKMHGILDEYVQFCRQKGVPAQKQPFEMDSIEKGIVECINSYGIRKLVMGAAAEKFYKRNMMEIKSTKAKYVRQKAPAFCHILFICKDRLIFTREASEETDTGQPNQLRSRSVTIGQRDSIKTGQSNYLPERSLTVGHNRDGSGMRMVEIPFTEGSEELPSLKKRLDAEGSSDEGDGLSRSSSRGGVNVTLASWTEGNENGLDLKALSLVSGFSRSSSSVEWASPSLKQSPSVISCTSSIAGCSSNGGLSFKDRSFDNSLYEQLQQAMEESENEASRRRKAEKDRIEAIRRVQDEMTQRKDIEEVLAKEREELKKVKNERDQLREELQISQEREISLNRQIEELQNQSDQLHLELDNALKEAEGLRRKQGEASSRQMQMFSEFLRHEIEEATQNFDESLKIGQGGYGNVYKGLLCHTKVAIKRLESIGVQGTSEFQMEVRVLSQLRHPNLVKLFGYCPEIYALIYEFLPNGNLEDRLKCKDNSPPLSWQTRIRIAIELCSVLLYLQNNKPHGIVHGDLKPSNILLDTNYVSKLSDFGISRLLQQDRNSSNTTLYHITDVKGTLPYIDPEFLETRVLTMKSDVYSYGIILLQLLTKKSPFSIANEVKSALEAGKLKTLLDSSAGDWPIGLAQKLARLGLRCCDRIRKNRPELGSDVWKVLEPMSASREL